MTRVQREVHDDLLENLSFRTDAACGVRVDFQLDVAPENALQERAERVQAGVHVDHRHTAGALCAKCQELAREAQGAFCCLGDGFRRRRKVYLIVHALFENLGVTEDDLEHVVEVMGDAARHLSDGIDALSADHGIGRQGTFARIADDPQQ